MAKAYQTQSPALNWDEDRYYTRSSRLGLIGALLLIIVAFIILPKDFSITPYSLKGEKEIVWEELPPVLVKEVEPPPVERPKLPVAATSPDQVEAATIGPTDKIESFRKITDVDPPTVPYWKVEVPPKSVYIPRPVYPEVARLAGIEGKVVVRTLVDIDSSIVSGKIIKGELIDVIIEKSSGNNVLDQAALEAARKARFTPAKQQDMLVRVWVSIPYEFKLTGK
ncbi:MAG: energy transducer TonB [candidate division WOR-3 bacterium]|nr:energy transducer TonB [candidate division WOR-3 bacterium]MDH5684377.1 energy transducer TonB [candidate division WOR-3 bacterium]